MMYQLDAISWECIIVVLLVVIVLLTFTRTHSHITIDDPHICIEEPRILYLVSTKHIEFSLPGRKDDWAGWLVSLG